MVLGQLIYVSDAADHLAEVDLETIACKSAANNAKQGITGILLYSEGHFVQLLEGNPEVIRNLYDKIVRDPRHHDAKLLMQRPARHRLFEDWSMGVLNLDRFGNHERMDMDDIIHLIGYEACDKQGLPIGLAIFKRFRKLLEAV